MFNLNLKPLSKTGLWGIWIAVLVVLLDQITKWWMSNTLQLGEMIPVFPGANAVLVHNYGAAFGFLNQGVGWQQWLFGLIALSASVLFLVWLWRTPAEKRLYCWGLNLLLGGAIGNLIDRLVYGYVIDFVDLYVGHWHWPAFNVADASISLGALLLIIQFLFYER